METLTRIAVITNAFIIAVTSDFIPQLVFKYSYSNPSGSLQGYVNFTLSYFDTKDLDTGNLPYTQNTSLPEICRWVNIFKKRIYFIIKTKHCFRFSGFYNPPWAEDKYEPNAKFYHIWFVRMLFVICFQTCVSLCLIIVDYIIPNIPARLRDKMRYEKNLISQ